MALDKLTIIDGGGLSTTSDYRVGIITATKFIGPIEGSITSTDANFTGSVSIGGTLTYEDVTNIDSVGIITARNGIDCNGDIDVDGHTELDNLRVSGIATVQDDLHIPDASKLLMGDDNEFRIYHNESNQLNYIVAYNNAPLLLRSRNADMIHCSPQGPVTLKYNGGTRATTSSSGFDVSGTLNVTGISTFEGNIDINADIDVDGHTNLDNVSIAGVTTMSGNLSITNANPILYFIDTGANPDYYIKNNNGYFDIYDQTNAATRLSISNTGVITIPSGNLNVNKDFDVDGHTNLDNVSVAGVTTIASGGKLSIGGVVPTELLHIADAGNPKILIEDTVSDNQVGVRFKTTNYNWIAGVHGGIDSFKISHSTAFGANDFFVINGAGNVSIIKDFDVDGHTNLDNVNIVGVTTHNGQSFFYGNGGAPLTWGDTGYTGHLSFDGSNNAVIRAASGKALIFQTDHVNTRMTIASGGNVSIEKDLDVDGHTNLDNVSVSGISTFGGSTQNTMNVSHNSGYAIRLNRGSRTLDFNANWGNSGNAALNAGASGIRFYYGSGSDGIQFNTGSGTDKVRITPGGNIGINHHQPSAGLHIKKQGRNFSEGQFYDGYNSDNGLGGDSNSIAGSQAGERTHSLILESTTTAAADRGASIGFRAKSGATLIDVTYAAIVGAKENSVTNSDPSNSYDDQAKGYLAFYTSNQYAYNPHYGTQNIERLRIDSTGALGLGVGGITSYFKNNSGNYRQLQIGLGAHFYGRTDDTPIYLVSNGYRDGSNWKYTANTTASQIAMGTHIVFETAGVGTAGNNISFDERLRITSGGDVVIGHSAANAKLHIASGTSSAVGNGTNPALQIGSTTNFRFGIYTDNETAFLHNKNGDDGIHILTKATSGGNATKFKIHADQVYGVDDYAQTGTGNQGGTSQAHPTGAIEWQNNSGNGVQRFSSYIQATAGNERDMYITIRNGSFYRITIKASHNSTSADVAMYLIYGLNSQVGGFANRITEVKSSGSFTVTNHNTHVNTYDSTVKINYSGSANQGLRALVEVIGGF